MINVTILGTSSMVPTKERNQSALLLSYKTHGILVDCGEGTQRQFKYAGLSLSKVTKILITHWHGDHVLGLPGLLSSLGANEYTTTLEIYGPKGTKKYFEHMFKAFAFDRKIQMDIKDIVPGRFFENREFALEAVALEHGTPCLGYRFIEKDRRRIQMAKAQKLGLAEGPLLGKLQRGLPIEHKGKKIKPGEVSTIVRGKSIGIIGDTQLCDGCYKIADNVDLLISESTYSSKFESKAHDYNHMTAAQVAQVASKSDAKKLILTHFSARYKSVLELTDEAQTLFPNTESAFDLMQIKV